MFRISILLAAVVISASVTGQERKEISLTVYNNDLGLVTEVRNLKINSGKSEVRLVDVPSRIDPTSVHFKSLNSPDKISILEQNYQFDLVSSAKLMERYIDQKIKVFSSTGKIYEGILMSFDGSNIVLNAGNSIVSLRLTDNMQNIEFPSLPKGLITKPTLVWLAENRGSKEQECQISYMTGGMNWHAEYVAVLDEEEKNINLGAWVSIDNRSGAGYENAKLKLIAGDVNRVQTQTNLRYAPMAKSAMAEAAPQFEEKAFFEYHLYTLQRRATVADNEIKQVSLFPNTDVRVKKVYVYDGARNAKDVRVNLEFKNDKASGLGMALPAGKVRTYKLDSDATQQFIGEDMIDHTPKDEKLRIFLGNAFDLVGERSQKDYKRINDRTQEQTVEVKLRNHKNESVEITVVEHIYGDWKVTQSSHKYQKKDAYTIEFNIAVPKDGEAVLNYTYRNKW
jgi:hypothetical protein